MSGSSNHTDIETIDLSPFSTVARELIREGVGLGWIARPVRGGNGMMLISPVDSSQTITIPGGNTSLRDSKAQGIARKLVRYGDPLRKAVVGAAIQTATGRGVNPLGAPVALDPAHPLMQTNDELTLPSSYMQLGAEPDISVVSEKPWLARRGTSDKKAHVYESGAVVERKWSDGSIDYKCSICDFTDPQPHRVARHYSRSSKDTHPPLSQGETMAAEPYVPATRSASAAARAERLARELAKATEAVGLPPQEGTEEWLLSVAREVINKRDERRDAEGEHEPVPLTPEQIIERIRGLVDDGSYLRRLERERDLEERLALAERSAEECRLRAEEAENEAEHIRSEWRAVIDVLRQSPYAGGVSDEGS